MATQEKLEAGEVGLGLCDPKGLAHLVDKELNENGELRTDEARAAFRQLQRWSEGEWTRTT